MALKNEIFFIGFVLSQSNKKLNLENEEKLISKIS